MDVIFGKLKEKAYRRKISDIFVKHEKWKRKHYSKWKCIDEASIKHRKIDVGWTATDLMVNHMKKDAKMQVDEVLKRTNVISERERERDGKNAF